jgi:uncharacterized LabA/DUF88 family protein
MASAKIYSIGLFIDGNYCWLIDKGLKGDSRRVNFKGLIKFIQKSIAEKYELDPSSCVVTETHYFRGRYKAYDAKAHNLLYDDRKYEDRLIENDVVLHYKHVYDLPDGTVHEKGIDVWFALETLELAMFRDFDFVVMITGDADYEMLARKLKSLKIPAILLSWHYDEQDPTAKALKEEISFQININSLLKADPSLINMITESASS